MTTVAWDGKTLAGDTQATSSCLIRRVPTKVHKLCLPGGEKVLFGCSGNDQDMHMVVAWIEDGMDVSKRPSFENGAMSALLIRSKGIYRLESRCVLLPVIDPFHAIGNGRDFAMAAMHLGRSAMEAVEIAARYDIYTSGPFTAVSLD